MLFYLVLQKRDKAIILSPWYLRQMLQGASQRFEYNYTSINLKEEGLPLGSICFETRQIYTFLGNYPPTLP